MSTQHHQKGSSLIEVLVSLVLVAVTMLGLLGLQLRSMGMQKDSLDRRNAAILVANFADRIAGNFDGANQGAYTGPLLMNVGDTPPAGTSACASSTSCTGLEIGKRDWELLQMEVRKRLPGGVVEVHLAPGGTGFIVTVGWMDPQRDAQDAEALKGSIVDAAPKDGIDDACAAIGVNDANYRCYVASIFP